MTVRYAFGYKPNEAHFQIHIPQKGNERVLMYECLIGQEETPPPVTCLRASLTRDQWDAIEATVANAFNDRDRLIAHTPPPRRGKWPEKGIAYLSRLYGKELVLLAWAIEQSDPRLINHALANWRGLAPEERWWLYTMTNAASGKITDVDRGWRKAVRYIMTENPVNQLEDPLEILNKNH